MIMLKKLLLSKGQSLSAFARKADLNATSLSAICNGRLRPYPAQVEKIVAALQWHGDPAPLFEDADDER